MADERMNDEHGNPGSPEEAADPEGRLAELRARLDEAEDGWRRAAADFDNLRKRVLRDADRQRAEERVRVAREWLPVLDNLDRALEHATSDPGQIVAGVKAVRDQAVAILARLGFPRRDEVGEVFDPGRHEAVATVADAQAPAGTVLHVVRPGYGDGGQQLRPASVVVATRAD